MTLLTSSVFVLAVIVLFLILLFTLRERIHEFGILMSVEFQERNYRTNLIRTLRVCGNELHLRSYVGQLCSQAILHGALNLG